MLLPLPTAEQMTFAAGCAGDLPLLGRALPAADIASFFDKQDFEFFFDFRNSRAAKMPAGPEPTMMTS